MRPLCAGFTYQDCAHIRLSFQRLAHELTVVTVPVQSPFPFLNSGSDSVSSRDQVNAAFRARTILFGGFLNESAPARGKFRHDWSWGLGPISPVQPKQGSSLASGFGRRLSIARLVWYDLVVVSSSSSSRSPTTTEQPCRL